MGAHRMNIAICNFPFFSHSQWVSYIMGWGNDIIEEKGIKDGGLIEKERREKKLHTHFFPL